MRHWGRRRRWGCFSVTEHRRRRAINQGRACEIFGNAQPPKVVHERQFDGFDEQLRRLARTPYKQMDFSDLWYYHHDLAHVELQPDLFAYLFPACFMDWHQSLMRNEACSHGDSEFHHGMRRGEVFEKMMTPDQRNSVFEFFTDSFVERWDSERGFTTIRNRAPTAAWIDRFNSVGLIMPRIDLLWDAWWSLETPGRAVAAIQYCSGLMYFDGDNPIFHALNGISPNLWKNDSYVYDVGWLDENVEFLKKGLTVDFVTKAVMNAAARLTGEPEWEKAHRLENELSTCRELIELRVNELPQLLSAPNPDGWSL